MSSTTPGADQLQALITYANEVDGGTDATISDAVYTLAQGYGQGGQEIVITESASNTLALVRQILADYSADSTKIYSIAIKSAHNLTAYNTIYGFVVIKTSDSTFDGSATRYRNGALSSANIAGSYDAAVTVGDIYEVTEIIPTIIS